MRKDEIEESLLEDKNGKATEKLILLNAEKQVKELKSQRTSKKNKPNYRTYTSTDALEDYEESTAEDI